jgi:aromatic-L-amino-acid decarboxylase
MGSDPFSAFGRLDPCDWQSARAQGHRMLDDILDYIENIRERPVWQPIPDDIRTRFNEPVPTGPSALAAVHDEFMRSILPFATGNSHPSFMGWVHGGGNVPGTLAEMLAAGLNANLGGRDHMPIEVERQIARWLRDLFGFPDGATGLFVTGTSMANLLGVLIARTRALGLDVRRTGIGASGKRLVAYTSAAAHGCISQAMDLSGLGTAALHVVPINERHQIDLVALNGAIAEDRKAGLTPFLAIGTAGSVDTGAIDDLAALADIARREALWFHVDGAIGALAIMAPDIAPRLAGIQQADSIALDFHKWGQVPYDAGFILVRDGTLHRDTFASPAAYLRRETRGLAAGALWPCDFGPDLSRGFRALKTWFTLKVYGTEALGAMISRTCELARHLEIKIATSRELELLAPVSLNIVCFRHRGDDPDRLNARIVTELHESGIAAPSTTTIDGRLAIRAAIVNHRTEPRDIDALVKAVLKFGATAAASHAA